MPLDKLALILFWIVGVVYALVVGAAIVFGMVQTFPYGLPVLIIGLLFLFICAAVIYQRLNNKEDRYYEENVDE